MDTFFKKLEKHLVFPNGKTLATLQKEAKALSKQSSLGRSEILNAAISDMDWGDSTPTDIASAVDQLRGPKAIPHVVESDDYLEPMPFACLYTSLFWGGFNGSAFTFNDDASGTFWTAPYGTTVTPLKHHPANIREWFNGGTREHQENFLAFQEPLEPELEHHISVYAVRFSLNVFARLTSELQESGLTLMDEAEQLGCVLAILTTLAAAESCAHTMNLNTEDENGQPIPWENYWPLPSGLAESYIPVRLDSPQGWYAYTPRMIGNKVVIVVGYCSLVDDSTFGLATHQQLDHAKLDDVEVECEIIMRAATSRDLLSKLTAPIVRASDDLIAHLRGLRRKHASE